MAKRSTLRASDADRDRVIDRLHKAATEGRIASEELEDRVSAALKARTYHELDETVADLPVTGRGRQPARRSAPQWALSAVRANPWLILFAVPALAVTAAMVLAVTILWMVLAVVVLLLGGRPRAARLSWISPRRDLPTRRRGPGSYWA